LPELIAQMRTAGLPVDYVVEGAAQRWSAAVELSAFRIMQEALTNVLRHAGPSRTTVRLRHERDGLDIEVLDEGHGSRQPSAGSRHEGPAGDGGNGAVIGGRDLTGMRERAEARQ
jgi:signal transduction histidine kinase